MSARKAVWHVSQPRSDSGIGGGLEGTELKPKLKEMMKKSKRSDSSILYNWWLSSGQPNDMWLTYLERLCQIIQGLSHKKDNWRFKWGPSLESRGLSKDLPHREQELQASSHARHSEKWLAAYLYQARTKQFKKKEHTYTYQYWKWKGFPHT